MKNEVLEVQNIKQLYEGAFARGNHELCDKLAADYPKIVSKTFRKQVADQAAFHRAEREALLAANPVVPPDLWESVKAALSRYVALPLMPDGTPDHAALKPERIAEICDRYCRMTFKETDMGDFSSETVDLNRAALSYGPKVPAVFRRYVTAVRTYHRPTATTTRRGAGAAATPEEQQKSKAAAYQRTAVALGEASKYLAAAVTDALQVRLDIHKRNEKRKLAEFDDEMSRQEALADLDMEKLALVLANQPAARDALRKAGVPVKPLNV